MGGNWKVRWVAIAALSLAMPVSLTAPSYASEVSPVDATAVSAADPTNRAFDLAVDETPAFKPDPRVAATLAIGAPAGLYAISMITPYRELMFLVPATYGAGHIYARDPWRALSMSAAGYGAAVAGLGFAVGIVSLWPGTSAESLSRVLWGGAFGVVGFGPFVAWDAMRTAEAKDKSEAPTKSKE